MTTISVLVVEDDPVAADAHTLYVSRTPGFRAAGTAHSCAAARRVLDRARAEGTPVDLILLDLHLPDGHGLQFCRTLRAAGHTADVIAVTSARDLAMVRSAVSAGVVQYLLKPFTSAALTDRLERYARYHATLARTGEATGQAANPATAPSAAPNSTTAGAAARARSSAGHTWTSRTRPSHSFDMSSTSLVSIVTGPEHAMAVAAITESMAYLWPCRPESRSRDMARIVSSSVTSSIWMRESRYAQRAFGCFGSTASSRVSVLVTTRMSRATADFR